MSLAFKAKDSIFIPTDSNQVLQVSFKKLNKSKGAGPDGIYHWFNIIDCTDFKLHPIFQLPVHLINL